MNTNKSKLKIITERAEWYDIISNEQLIIHDIHQSNPEILQVNKFYFKAIKTKTFIK